MKKTLLNVLHIMINIFIGYFFLIDVFIATIHGSIWIIILLLLFVMTLRLLLILIPYRGRWDMCDVTTIKIEEKQEYSKINKLTLFKTQTDWALYARTGQPGAPEFPLRHAASCHAGQALNFGVSSTEDWRSNRAGLVDCFGETSSLPVGASLAINERGGKLASNERICNGRRMSALALRSRYCFSLFHFPQLSVCE